MCQSISKEGSWGVGQAGEVGERDQVGDGAVEQIQNKTHLATAQPIIAEQAQARRPSLPYAVKFLQRNLGSPITGHWTIYVQFFHALIHACSPILIHQILNV